VAVRVNVKFVLRAALLAIPLAVLITAGWILLQTPWFRPLDPTPIPPRLLVPAGEPPPGPVGLQEWVRYRQQAYQLAGCGFFLSLPEGPIVAVTTAHSVAQAGPDQPLERIAFRVAGHEAFVAEFDRMAGPPGRPLTPENLSVDYLLLQVREAVDPALVLAPDRRGAPQPGERVWLVSGLEEPSGGSGQGSQAMRAGTVLSASSQAIWVLMDDRFNPALMSGSPLLSQHTGRAVGLAVAASPRGGRLLLGANPISSLLEAATSATGFRPLEELDLVRD
jgi:hypothetical protein